MKTGHLAASSLLILGSLLAASTASADDDPMLGAAVDGRVEAGVDDAGAASTAQAGRTPARRSRSYGRIRGGAGFGVLGAFDDAGSGALLTLEGRLGAQLNRYVGLYAQGGLHGGDMDQPGGLDARAGYATFAVVAELHPIDELAIGIGPIAMAGFRDEDQIGGRYADHDFARDRYLDFGNRRHDEVVSRWGAVLRISPAIGDERASGRIHAFRPSFEIAVLGTPRDVLAPEQPLMVLAGLTLNWDTW